MTLDAALRLQSLGLSLIPLAPRTKAPARDVLPVDDQGDPTWKSLQTERPSDADFRRWFGNGVQRNAGILLGPGSGVVAIETDSPEAEHWVATHLPATPMATRSARGVHRFYRLPTGPDSHAPIPATITIGNLKIEIKRTGQYVVGPGSVHPSGHVYTEVAPWPASLASVPEFPMSTILTLVGTTTAANTPPLPATVESGSRNDTLFREGCRLRRLGWDDAEIVIALGAINQSRCHPALEAREVETIARSCAGYAPAADTFPTTETGDAEFFVACNADTVRYDHRRGRWMLFEGHVWVPQTHGEIARLALDAIRARQRAAVGDKARLKWAADGESRKRQNNLLALAQNMKPVADAGDSWDVDPWLLGAPNGVIDLQEGTLRAGRPEDRITMRVRAAFDPDAVCPLYDQTVAEIFEQSVELIAYFDAYIGYSLTGDCREESLALCWGDGANGKGTLLNTIGWLLGDYADDLPFSAFELHSRAGIPNDIAKIVNKRFITASETGETTRLNESRVKALTGRDPITARFLHKEFFTFQPVAKFWLSTNHKPDVRDDSEGFWRRLHLIPFAASFIGREDKTLKDRLRDEAPGILARTVRGCLTWQRGGLNPPEVVREATQTYRAASMPLARFLDECCMLSDQASTSFGELFAAYVKWCGRETRMGRHEFNAALRQRFETDATAGKHLPVMFKGVGLLDELL